MEEFQESYVRDRFDEMGVDLGRICIRTCGKYIGIFLGRGGGEVSWRDPMVKYVRRVREIRGLGLGLVETILSYKSLALPVTQFVAQFLEPPPA
eukprot:431836-Pyramimonas_sp.AAC.1